MWITVICQWINIIAGNIGLTILGMSQALLPFLHTVLGVGILTCRRLCKLFIDCYLTEMCTG